MTRSIALPNHLSRRLVGACLTLGMVTAPLPVFAAPPKGNDKGAEGEAATPATAGGNIAILKFTGDDYQANVYREKVRDSLQAQGYTANFIKRSIEEAQATNKCRTLDNACLEKIGACLNKNSKTAYDFYVWAEVPSSGAGTVVVYDVAKKQKIVELDLSVSYNDIILVEVIGNAVAKRVAETQVPPSPATAEEQEILATLDQPKETPEEIEQRKRDLDKAAEDAAVAAAATADAGEQSVDLRAEFKDFCRTGPREDKEVEGDDGEIIKERDLRPACKRGPVFGYWQPRAWVALTLTVGSAAGMGVMYGLAAAARSDWRKAADALEASGLSDSDPNNSCDGDVCYADLAGEVSNATAQVRRRAIIGDVLLGSTVLLAGVLAIIIYQDRQAAKAFLANEKELRAISNLRLGPVFGETNGAALSFEF
ncbi:MAG TPA: hypothetical protein VK034_23450 [Enhygromyxa sp.]|nr:hypothetical protein [Enhygromyxa sp.]